MTRYWLALVLFLQIPISHAEFDCNQPGDEQRSLVCSTPAVLELDRKLDELLVQAKQTEPNVEQKQAEWIRNIRSSCVSIYCLNTTYLARIKNPNPALLAVSPVEKTKVGQGSKTRPIHTDSGHGHE